MISRGINAKKSGKFAEGHNKIDWKSRGVNLKKKSKSSAFFLERFSIVQVLLIKKVLKMYSAFIKKRYNFLKRVSVYSKETL